MAGGLQPEHRARGEPGRQPHLLDAGARLERLLQESVEVGVPISDDRLFVEQHGGSVDPFVRASGGEALTGLGHPLRSFRSPAQTIWI